MKLGVVTPAFEAKSDAVPKSTAQEMPSAPSSEEKQAVGSSDSRAPYSDWGKVLTKIGELKAPLAGGLASASVTRAGNNFFVKAKGFFVKKILANADDFAILKGVIAQCEGLAKDSINVELISAESSGASDNASELDKLFG